MDPDQESIKRARIAAPQASFTTEMPKGQPFDLITLCDVLHDLAAPLEALRDIRRLLKADGTLFIVEPKAADRLEDNRNPVATMFYGFSLFHCMTQSLARGGPGLGTCMGPRKTEALVREAGFRDFRMLDIKSMTKHYYAAQP
jgi:2-polyprenyl-3-methyl-5-hydroxy-6-metoxy-1,4-benzoquinol methylase